MEARDRVGGSIERKSKIVSPTEKEFTVHHEMGRALASCYLEHLESLVRVSISLRGKLLGSAWYLPEESHNVTKSQFTDQNCASLGGRAAEEIIFGEPS